MVQARPQWLVDTLCHCERDWWPKTPSRVGGQGRTRVVTVDLGNHAKMTPSRICPWIWWSAATCPRFMIRCCWVIFSWCGRMRTHAPQRGMGEVVLMLDEASEDTPCQVLLVGLSHKDPSRQWFVWTQQGWDCFNCLCLRGGMSSIIMPVFNTSFEPWPPNSTAFQRSS